MKSTSTRSTTVTALSLFSMLVIFLAGSTVVIAKEQSFIYTSGKHHIAVCHLTWMGEYKLLMRPKSEVLGHLMHHEADTLPVKGVCVEPVTYEIGDTGPGGGVVFDVIANGLHGMEVGPDVLPHWLEWGCVGTNIPGAEGTAVGTGEQNTQDILAGCSTPGIIARRVDDFEWGSRTDWFLPSTGELLLIYERLHLTGLSDFDFCYYHSSSELSRDLNRLVNFCQGTVRFALKGNVDDIHVLPVRTF